MKQKDRNYAKIKICLIILFKISNAPAEINFKSNYPVIIYNRTTNMERNINPNGKINSNSLSNNYIQNIDKKIKHISSNSLKSKNILETRKVEVFRMPKNVSEKRLVKEINEKKIIREI